MAARELALLAAVLVLFTSLTVLVEAGHTHGAAKRSAGFYSGFGTPEYEHIDLYQSAEETLGYSQRIKTAAEIKTAADHTLVASEKRKDDARTRLTVLRAFKVATSWGNLQSIDLVKDWLEREGLRAVNDGRGAGLGDMMYYLYQRKCFMRDAKDRFLRNVNNMSAETDYQYQDKDAILLDPVTLRRLEGVRAYREHLKENLDNIMFVVPYGWEGGLHMFTRPAHFTDKITKFGRDFLGHYERCQEGRGADGTVVESCALDALFKEPVLRRVAAALPELDLNKVVFIHRYEDTMPEYAEIDESIEERGKIHEDIQATTAEIAKNIRPKMPTADDLREFTQTVRPCVPGPESDYNKDVKVLDYLNAHHNINTIPVTMEHLSSLFLNVRLDNYAFDNIVIPEMGKSTCIVVHALFSMNENLDASKLLYMDQYGHKIEHFGDHVDRRLLIIDDLSLSGTQLVGWSRAYSKLPGVREVRVGAIFVSPEGKEYMEEKGLAYYIGKLMPVSPPPRLWMVGSGYKKGRFNTALSWMAPDNNNVAFRQLLAPKVTFCVPAVKFYDPDFQYPDCSTKTPLDIHIMQEDLRMSLDESKLKGSKAKKKIDE